MKLLILFSFLFFIIFINAASATTIKFKYNDSSANVKDMVNDTWIQSANPATNYGTDAGVGSNVNMGCDGATSVGRSMFRFAIYPNIPAGSTINSATLNISEGTYCYSGANPFTDSFQIDLHRIIKTWINTDPTWNNFNLASGNYTSIKIDNYTVDCGADHKDANNNNHIIFQGEGLRDYVRGVVNGTYGDYGFYLRLEHETCVSGVTPNETSVYMSDHATVDLHPSLTIDYTEQQLSTTTTGVSSSSSTTTTTIFYNENCTDGCDPEGQISDLDCDTCVQYLDCQETCPSGTCLNDTYCYFMGGATWGCGCCCTPLSSTTVVSTTVVSTTLVSSTTTTTYPESCSEECDLLPIFPNGFESCYWCVANLTDLFGACADICVNIGTVSCGNDLWCLPFEEQYYCGCCCAPTTTTTSIPIGNNSIPYNCCPIYEIRCFDNNTLIQKWNISYWDTANNISSFNVSTAFANCPYGCDTNNNECNPKPIQQYSYYFLVLVGIIVVVGLIYALWGRK